MKIEELSQNLAGIFPLFVTWSHNPTDSLKRAEENFRAFFGGWEAGTCQ